FEARYRRGGGGIQTRQPFALNDSVDRPRPEGDAFRFQERYQLVAAPPILGPQRDEAVGDRRTCPLWTPHWPPRPVRQRANRVRGVVPPAPFVARFSADAEGSTHRRHLRAWRSHRLHELNPLITHIGLQPRHRVSPAGNASRKLLPMSRRKVLPMSWRRTLQAVPYDRVKKWYGGHGLQAVPLNRPVRRA